jgi:hypothetical protein
MSFFASHHSPHVPRTINACETQKNSMATFDSPQSILESSFSSPKTISDIFTSRIFFATFYSEPDQQSTHHPPDSKLSDIGSTRKTVPSFSTPPLTCFTSLRFILAIPNHQDY